MRPSEELREAIAKVRESCGPRLAGVLAVDERRGNTNGVQAVQDRVDHRRVLQDENRLE